MPTMTDIAGFTRDWLAFAHLRNAQSAMIEHHRARTQQYRDGIASIYHQLARQSAAQREVLVASSL